MSNNEEYHVTRVIGVRDDVGETRYQPVCSLCGRFGVPQHYEGDAWAIADRHASVQGFDR